jgi:hypothetical protein
MGLLVCTTLGAQIPYGWNQRTALGSDLPGTGAWYGGGLWSGDHHGPAPTLTDSLGMGNALTGNGFHLEAGYRSGNWDLAAEVLGNRDDQGATYLTLYRSHLWYRGNTGWQGGFEQEPLVWGYGLNGGYLLGEAARPFPRLRLESPMADLHLFRVPLGTWGFQVFMGRMENHPVVSSSIQTPSWTEHQIPTQGNPEAPLLMGYRAQAQFGPLSEFYLNYLNLWAGTLNGRAMVSGYNLGEYLTAMTGLKDTLAESTATTYSPLVNNARSASEVDVGFRQKLPVLAEMMGADGAQAYISRGSKQTAWLWGTFIKNPPKYFGRDVSTDLKDVIKGNLSNIWYGYGRYTAPSLAQPNDAVGLLLDWPGVRFGLEYFACVDQADRGFRPFTNGTYLTGFYYYGDPLGTAIGGEAVTTTAKLEVDYSAHFSGSTSVTRGFRPFRDDPTDWQTDHPGQTPGKNRFTGVQQTLGWNGGGLLSADLGAAWQREGAVDNVAGASGDGFVWFADLRFRWKAGN